MHDDYGRWDGQGDYEGYRGYTPPAASSKRGWNTGDAPKVCTNCDWLPKTDKQLIYIDHETWKVLKAICVKVKVEWQALLKGVIEEDGAVRITGYYIPKQEVSPASVKNLDVIDDEFITSHGIVAGVHSHANMGVFFSTTDVEHTNMSLIKHNIVINNMGEYKAESRVELPCKLVKFIDADVFITGEPEVPVVGLENITERKFGFQTSNVPSFATPHWDIARDKPSASRYPGYLEGMRRWCPVCDLTPEEDDGKTCICWTTGKRSMLPEFTEAYYKKGYGTTYTLKNDSLVKVYNTSRE